MLSDFGALILIGVRFCLDSEHLKKIRFVFNLSSVNVGFGFFIDGIERCFRGGK